MPSGLNDMSLYPEVFLAFPLIFSVYFKINLKFFGLKQNNTSKRLKKQNEKCIKIKHRVINLETYTNCGIMPKSFQIAKS